MKKELIEYIIIISLLYVSGAVVDAMIESHSKYPSERLFINMYQLFYLAIIMVILIPLVVYYASKLAIKIGPRKPVILLIFLLPFSSALWDITYGAIIYKNPFWVGINIKDWFTMPVPGGELDITIPLYFSTSWVIIRIIIGTILMWVFFKKVLPSKRI